MNEFSIFWRDGTRQVIEGRDITDAFNKHYSAGALAALDFYSSGNDEGWVWSKEEREWRKAQ